jgi:AraC-like DNA-binding protein
LEETDISPANRASPLVRVDRRRNSRKMTERTWLARFVDNVRVVEPGGPRQIVRLPDGRTCIALRVLDGAGGGDLSVAGPRTRALFKTATGIARAITIEFKPGWSTQLLGVSAADLTDRFVKLDDLWGRAGAELRDQLLASRSASEIVDRIARVITARSQQIVEPASARLARRAVRLLEIEDVPIASVAKRLGVTARHLRRAFLESIGIGPKDFARTVRLDRAVRSAAISADWGRIAANAGYYDQAHLIGDFRDLVGLTPNAFAKHRLEDRLRG